MSLLRFVQNSPEGQSVANERIMSGFVNSWQSTDWIFRGILVPKKLLFFTLTEAWFQRKRGLVSTCLSLITDAFKAYLRAVSGLLTP